MIRITPVRVIGPDNEQIGVIDTAEAVRMAQEQGLDLVEIVPDSRPPVCKIMDYGKFKYEQSKKENKKSSSTELKEVRLGRSVKIDPHDVEIRVQQARRFLIAGHRVQFTQRFRGREIMHRDIGLRRLDEIIEALADVAKVESPPRWMGKSASILLAPDKNKVEQVKRQMEKDRQAKLAKGEKADDDLSIEELEAQVEAQNREAGDDDEDDGAEGTAPAGGSAKSKGSDKEGTKDERAKDDRKKKGPKDDRASNPIDDEINALLGE